MVLENLEKYGVKEIKMYLTYPSNRCVYVITFSDLSKETFNVANKHSSELLDIKMFTNYIKIKHCQ